MDFFWRDNRNIRRIWHKNAWWFVIEDVVSTFISNQNANDYIKTMKILDPEFNKWLNQYSKILKLTDSDSEKQYCTNLEGIFRVIQSINLPKAEPFKLWLARLGKERLDKLIKEI